MRKVIAFVLTSVFVISVFTGCIIAPKKKIKTETSSIYKQDGEKEAQDNVVFRSTQYTSIDFFYEDDVISKKYFVVSEGEGDDKKYGIINDKGERVVDCLYKRLDNEISQGLICASLGKKYGFIDLTGKQIIPFTSYFVYRFDTNGHTLVQMGEKDAVIDTKGNIILSSDFIVTGGLEDGYIMTGVFNEVTHDHQYKLVDLKGNVILNSLDIPGSSFMKYDNGVVWVSVKNGEDSLMQGLMDLKGNWIKKPFMKSTDWVSFDDRGYTSASLEEGGGDQGVVDNKGNILVEFSTHRVEELENGMMLVREIEGAPSFVFDPVTSAKRMLPANVVLDGALAEVNLIVSKDTATEKLAILDLDGNPLTEYIYDSLDGPSGDYYSTKYIYAESKENGVVKKRLLDKDLKVLFDYSEYDEFYYDEGYAAVQKGKEVAVLKLS